MTAILKREFKAYFTSPIGFVFLTVYLFISGLVFVAFNISGNSSDMKGYFSFMTSWPSIIVLPLLTMKLLSDERKNKTDQLLLTSPVSIPKIVMGKFFAAYFIYLIAISSTIVYTIFLWFFTTPDFISILSNLIGMMFIGMFFVAVGLFASSLTENQMISAIISFIILFVFFIIDFISSLIQIQFIADFIDWLAIFERYNDFTLGVLNISTVIYFLSLTAFFIFMTIRVIEKRRWN